MASGSFMFSVTAAGIKQLSSTAVWVVRGDGDAWQLPITVDTSLGASFDVPATYAGGGMTFTIPWAAQSATSAGWRARIEAKAFTDDTDDIDTVAYGTATEATLTAASAAGEPKYATLVVSHANLGSPAVGERVILKLTRVGTDGVNDTMTGGAEVWGLRALET